MANDITSINTSKAQQASSRQTQRSSDANSDSGSRTENRSASAGADKVSLTNTAARLKDIEQRLANQTGVDEKRVNAMRAAIDNDRYEVDADRVAGKMINFENSLRP
ncbi:MAG: flagellar biosynthesis anti-sigma factor FlgM [Gammaproteobacteria bacterium]|nr:flagellar biosynthesis anti-sigma factor FlgM [Gammaproteobacteria bacterium]